MISKIALEEHFVPAGLPGLITDPGWAPAQWQLTLDLLADTENRLEAMDEAGISMAVLSLGSNGIQDILDPGESVTLAREVNDALARGRGRASRSVCRAGRARPLREHPGLQGGSGQRLLQRRQP